MQWNEKSKRLQIPADAFSSWLDVSRESVVRKKFEIKMDPIEDMWYLDLNEPI